MKRETILSKKIIREIDKSMINSDFKLELNKLLEDKYFNFEIEEWYGEEFKIKGELKNKIIKTLIKVYYDWKMELEKLNKKYYLAIWLHNPRLLKCEIVCAIDEKIAYYENDAHMSSENLSDFDSNQFGNGKIFVEKRILKDYLQIINQIELPKSGFEITEVNTEKPIERIHEIENSKMEKSLIDQQIYKKTPKELTNSELEFLIEELIEDEKHAKFNKGRRMIKKDRIELETELEKRK